MRRAACLAALAGLLTACGGLQLGGSRKKVVLKDFAEGRVVQVGITDRLTGAKEMIFVSMPQRSWFLEGYIQGIVTDYDDNPVQGVVVRAQAKGEERFLDKNQAAFQTSSFDAGVSDSNGVYRIRFSLPVIKNIVDIQGRLIYNPGWEQELANLGRAYEPQAKESPFRLYFDMKEGMLIFSEGVRKLVVSARESKKPGKGKALPGASREPAEEKASEPAAKPEDDLFKGFGFGSQ